MRAPETNEDAITLALGALVWTLGDDDRASRLLALTGLDAAALRAGAGDPPVLAALLAFLESHEPDLVACAAATGTSDPISPDAVRLRLPSADRSTCTPSAARMLRLVSTSASPGTFSSRHR